MHRTFYSVALLIEVDRCSSCGVTWFDKDELDMVQWLVEKGTTTHAAGPAPAS
jgi:Zn-finger nucleic acid-binding protein